MPPPACPLCDGPGGELVYAGAALRVVRTDEGGFPAFYRVIWQRHVREFSQLAPADRALCTEALVAVEQVLLEHLAPDKVNLASLGNAVPHLHWHVIARFAWDTHFPAPVWAVPLRPAPAAQLDRVVAARAALARDLAQRLAHLEGSPSHG
jgi:diadenosine tetraphosphate (Ap4A) HIT family hydrolase